MDNPQIKIVKCVGALKMKTCFESLQKRTLGLIFNIEKSQFLTLSLQTEEIFKLPKADCSKSFSCRFSFSATRYAIIKATEYVIFGFLFAFILVSFPSQESLNVTVCKRYGFFSVSVAIIQKYFDKQPWIENGEGDFVIDTHSLTCPSCASDVEILV